MGKQLKRVKGLELAGMLAAFQNEGPVMLPRYIAREWQPKTDFTPEQLAEIRALPKRERQKRVKELKEKLLQANQ